MLNQKCSLYLKENNTKTQVCSLIEKKPTACFQKNVSVLQSRK